MRDGTGVRLYENVFTLLQPNDVAELNTIITSYPVKAVSRMYSISEEKLEKQRQEVIRSSGKTDVPDLNSWFIIKVDGNLSTIQIDTLITRLNQVSLVETAYLEPEYGVPVK